MKVDTTLFHCCYLIVETRPCYYHQEFPSNTTIVVRLIITALPSAVESSRCYQQCTRGGSRRRLLRQNVTDVVKLQGTSVDIDLLTVYSSTNVYSADTGVLRWRYLGFIPSDSYPSLRRSLVLCA